LWSVFNMGHNLFTFTHLNSTISLLRLIRLSVSISFFLKFLWCIVTSSHFSFSLLSKEKRNRKVCVLLLLSHIGKKNRVRWPYKLLPLFKRYALLKRDEIAILCLWSKLTRTECLKFFRPIPLVREIDT
jgi:hypothetical protein